MYLNSSLQSLSLSHNNYGWSGAIVGENFRLGRLVSGNYPKNLVLNQFAIWDNDQSANALNLYNGGNTQDLRLLLDQPSHYYEFENSVNTIQDLVGNAHLSGYNFSNADLISEAP